MKNCESFKSFGYIYIYIYIHTHSVYSNKMIILFKYCKDVENCKSFRGFSFIIIIIIINIYIYIYRWIQVTHGVTLVKLHMV